METQLVHLDPYFTDDELSLAADLIRQGDLVAFPTETVYGLGADGLSDEAVAKIFQAKGRPQDNPLILHVDTVDRAKTLVQDLPPHAQDLMEAFWPGPLTLVMNKSDLVPDRVTAGGPTVAIRMPDAPLALALIRLADRPLAAPSANLSGRPSPTRAQDVMADLSGKIACVIDGGDTAIGIESTVLDLTGPVPTILRPGHVTPRMLEAVLPLVAVDQALVQDQAIPKSPGQKYKHYAPKAGFTVFVGDPDAVCDRIRQEVQAAKKQDLVSGILVFDDLVDRIQADHIQSLGDPHNLSDMGHRLFTALRTLDQAGVDWIFGQGVKEEGFGFSLMNRMRKAASGRVIFL